MDSRLGPWLDLNSGGIAVGAPQGKDPNFGTLERGSLLPQKGEGFLRRGSDTSSWGTGHMVSLLQHSAAAHARSYPADLIRVGDIAFEKGGKNKGHKSHQNGLDADLMFVGMTRYGSVLDKEGKVTELFQTQKNWDYWKSLVAQRFARDGKVKSIVGLILVAPEIKKHMCEWAKANGQVDDELGRAVLQRLYPTAGHDDHFHLRLLCSPYHERCTGEFTPGKLGC